MLRIEVSESGGAPLPAVDIADRVFAIGSGPAARVRLPASVAVPEHVVIDASGPRGARGATWKTADASGEIGDGHVFELGTLRVRVAPAPLGTLPTPPQRTESLARELVRALLGGDAAPSLEVVRGPHAGAKRALAPPESALVIGRGDAAAWVIPDPDLSKAHAEIRRGWDGVRVVDLGSKNGTRVDGERVGSEGDELNDGAIVELGKLALRYRDPAEAQLGAHGGAKRPARPAGRPARMPRRSQSAWFYVALVIAAIAFAALVGLGIGWLTER